MEVQTWPSTFDLYPEMSSVMATRAKVTTSAGLVLPAIYPSDPWFWDLRVYAPYVSVRRKRAGTCAFNLWGHQMVLASVYSEALRRGKWPLHVKPRREGSSTLFTLALQQHTAFRPSCDTAIVANKKETATELTKAAILFHNSTPEYLKRRRHPGKKRTLEYIFSRTTGEERSEMSVHSVRDEDPLRGAGRLVVLATELSSWKESVVEKAWAAVRSTVPMDGGILIGESTPKRDGDPLQVVWREAEDPDSKWLRIHMPWTMVQEYSVEPPPGWTPSTDVRDYADKYKLTSGQAYWMAREGLSNCENKLAVFMAEYPITEWDCWVRAGGSVFPAEPLRERLRDLDGGTGLVREQVPYVQFEAYEKGHTYVVILDPASSFSQRDLFGMRVMDLDTCSWVSEYLGPSTAWDSAEMVDKESQKYGGAMIYVDAPGVGEGVLSHLIHSRGAGDRVFHRPGEGPRSKKIPGWWPSKGRRVEAVATLGGLIEDGTITDPSTRAIRQMLNYRGGWDVGTGDRDESGGHFELVSCSAIGAWVWLHVMQGGWRPKLTEASRRKADWAAFLRQWCPPQAGPGQIVTRQGVHR